MQRTFPLWKEPASLRCPLGRPTALSDEPQREPETPVEISLWRDSLSLGIPGKKVKKGLGQVAWRGKGGAGASSGGSGGAQGPPPAVAKQPVPEVAAAGT